MSPVVDPNEIQVGDIVLVKWNKGHLFHMVGEIRSSQFLIVNSLGKVNGWVIGKDILDRITNVIEPEPRPNVPTMLEQLSEAYHSIIQIERTSDDDAQRLLGIVDDLRWYADRIGIERLDAMPRLNKWSFEQNLWRLTKLAKKMTAPIPNRIGFFIDSGKMCVGLAGEIFALFEYGEKE